LVLVLGQGFANFLCVDDVPKGNVYENADSRLSIVSLSCMVCSKHPHTYVSCPQEFILIME